MYNLTNNLTMGVNSDINGTIVEGSKYLLVQPYNQDLIIALLIIIVIFEAFRTVLILHNIMTRSK